MSAVNFGEIRFFPSCIAVIWLSNTLIQLRVPGWLTNHADTKVIREDVDMVLHVVFITPSPSHSNRFHLVWIKTLLPLATSQHLFLSHRKRPLERRPPLRLECLTSRWTLHRWPDLPDLCLTRFLGTMTLARGKFQWLILSSSRSRWNTIQQDSCPFIRLESRILSRLTPPTLFAALVSLEMPQVPWTKVISFCVLLFASFYVISVISFTLAACWLLCLRCCALLIPQVVVPSVFLSLAPATTLYFLCSPASSNFILLVRLLLWKGDVCVVVALVPSGSDAFLTSLFDFINLHDVIVALCLDWLVPSVWVSSLRLSNRPLGHRHELIQICCCNIQRSASIFVAMTLFVRETVKSIFPHSILVVMPLVIVDAYWCLLASLPKWVASSFEFLRTSVGESAWRSCMIRKSICSQGIDACSSRIPLQLLPHAYHVASHRRHHYVCSDCLLSLLHFRLIIPSF